MSLSPDVARMKRELADLVAIDTQNPPGDEARAAQFLRRQLMAEGFEVALQEYKPARVNVVARLANGAGPVSRPPLRGLAVPPQRERDGRSLDHAVRARRNEARIL